MNTSDVLLSAVLQGLTEFLPVSSSGHLVILHWFLGVKESIIFDIILHIGTLFAVIIYFWKDCISLLTSQRRLLGLILIASLATFILGIFFKDFFEGLFQKPRFIGYSLIVTAILISIAARVYKNFELPKKDPTIFDSLIIGIAQGIAIIPGISRSGATISAGFLRGVDKIQAFRFSLILSIPAIIGSLFFKFKDLGVLKNEIGIFNILAGLFVSFLTGIIAIGLLKKIIIKNYFHLFGIYCFFAGIFVLVVVK